MRFYFVVALKRVSLHPRRQFLERKDDDIGTQHCSFILRQFFVLAFVCTVRAEVHFRCKSQPQCIHFSLCALFYLQKSERICNVWNNVSLAGDWAKWIKRSFALLFRVKVKNSSSRERTCASICNVLMWGITSLSYHEICAVSLWLSAVHMARINTIFVQSFFTFFFLCSGRSWMWLLNNRDFLQSV